MVVVVVVGGLMGASKFQCIGETYETHVQMKGYKLVQAKILRHMECEGDFVNFQVVGGSPPVPTPPSPPPPPLSEILTNMNHFMFVQSFKVKQ